MTDLARKAGMSWVRLYRALRPDGNPNFATVTRITPALGMKVRIDWWPRATTGSSRDWVCATRGIRFFEKKGTGG